MDGQDEQDGQQRQGGQKRQDGQHRRDRVMLHEEITRAIIGCAFEVSHELGAGFVESVYEKAMLIVLEQKGLAVQSQQPIEVVFRGKCVGDFYADLLVEEKVILELKAVKAIAPEHQAQIINYLNATGTEMGLLINFGDPRLEYKRFTRSKGFHMDGQDRQD